MPVFIYKAKQTPQKTVIGEIEAEDINSAVSRLKKKGLFPFSVRKKGADIFHLSSLVFFKKVSFQDVNIFVRQLANLVRSGLPLAKALNSLTKQTNNKYLRAIIEDVESQIKKGKGFYEALNKYSKVFSPFFINMIRAGEAGGLLEEVLERLVEIREREQDLKNQIRGALAYPVLLIIISLLIVFVLLTFIIPKFSEMFEELGYLLPLPTRILLNTSHFFNTFWPAILTAVVIIVIVVKKFSTGEKGAFLFDKYRLKIPLVGEVFKEIEISRFTRIFGTLLKNGVPILEALKITSQTIENKLFVNETKCFLEGIERGRKFSNLMREGKLFPPSVSDLIAVGEETAGFEQILLDISDSYEKESQVRIKMFMSILEPVLILILAIMVMFIVLSMLLPIFDISALLK
ncbi:MAG: type II secretion system F family protein [Candidatus Omnitrophota bacterium]